MTNPDFPVFDADNHLYECPRRWLEYLPKQLRPRHPVRRGPRAHPPRDEGQAHRVHAQPDLRTVARPGAHVDFYRGNNPEGLSLREMSGQPIDCIPAFREPAPRLAAARRARRPPRAHVPDASPTSSSTRSPMTPTSPTPRSMRSTSGSSTCGRFDYQSRIFTTPVITLPIVEEAINELDWVLEHGAKIVLIRPAPVNGLRGPRSIALPEFDPIWARLQEAEVPVACTRRSRRSPATTRRGSRAAATARSRPPRSSELLLQHREVEDAHRRDDLPGRAVTLPRPAHPERRERRQLGRPPASTSSTPRTGRCRRSSPSIRWRCSGATCT